VRVHRVAVLLCALGFAGCSDDPPESLEARCERIQRDWRAAVEELGDSCSTPSDCTLVGSSNAFAPLGGCEGEAVNRAALEARPGELDAITQGWSDCTCDIVGCVSDCSPGIADCVNGHCVTRMTSLCFPGIDAGVDAN